MKSSEVNLALPLAASGPQAEAERHEKLDAWRACVKQMKALGLAVLIGSSVAFAETLIPTSPDILPHASPLALDDDLIGRIEVPAPSASDKTATLKIAAATAPETTLFERDVPASRAYALALGGGLVVVAAPWAEVVAADSSGVAPKVETGALLVWRRLGPSWALVRRLVPENPGIHRLFGRSVALKPPFLAVSVVEFDQAAAQPRWVEKVFVYRLAPGGPKLMQELRGQDGEGFGTGLAFSGDQLVVGSTNVGCCGGAYVYGLAENSWTLVATLDPPSLPGTPATYGHRVAAADGTVALSGSGLGLGDGWAPPGAIHVFVRGASGFGPGTQLRPTGLAAGTAFGGSPAAVTAADRILVKEGDVLHEFRQTPSGWAEVKRHEAWSASWSLSSFAATRDRVAVRLVEKPYPASGLPRSEARLINLDP